MKSSKRQSIIVIGFGLIILSGVMLYFALSIPRISISSTDSSYRNSQSTVSSQTEGITENSYTMNTSSRNYTDNSNDINNSSAEAYVAYPLNLNSCTAQELMTIDGIGEKKASDIIEYRDYLGGYTNVEQIKNIKGIGDAIFEKISPYLTV